MSSAVGGKIKTEKELKKEVAKAAKLAKFHEKLKKAEVKANQAKHPTEVSLM